jgi:hypothetical protein
VGAFFNRSYCFARHPTGLKLREQRLACYAALPDDTHTNNSKRDAQGSGEFIGECRELFCIDFKVGEGLHYSSWAASPALPSSSRRAARLDEWLRPIQAALVFRVWHRCFVNQCRLTILYCLLG